MGYQHPDYLLKELTVSQFAEWEAFYKESPFGVGAWVTRFTYAVYMLLPMWMKPAHWRRMKFTELDPFHKSPLKPKLSFEQKLRGALGRFKRNG